MKKFIHRLIALLLFIGAIGGFIFSVSGLAWIWNRYPVITDQIDPLFQWLDGTLDASSAALVVAKDTLNITKTNLAEIHVLLRDTSLMLADVANLTKATGDTAKNSAMMVEETRISLDSVRSGMKVVDTMLRLISNIPFIGMDYSPRESLDSSFSRVADSMIGLPASIQAVQKDLNSTSKNIEVLKRDIDVLDTQLKGIDQNLSAAGLVVEQYVRLIDEASTELTRLRMLTPNFIKTVLFLCSTFLVWLMIAQVGLFLQACTLWVDSNKS